MNLGPMKMAVLGIEKVGRILEKMATDVDGREWVVRAMTAPQSGKKLCVLTIIWCFYECFFDISVQRILMRTILKKNNALCICLHLLVFLYFLLCFALTLGTLTYYIYFKGSMNYIPLWPFKTTDILSPNYWYSFAWVRRS